MYYYGDTEIVVDSFGMKKYQPSYDWCFSGSRRTPVEYPYSYDAHYTWCEFDKENAPKNHDCSYSDRMRDWDPKKYEEARLASGGGWIENISEDQAKKFVEVYWGGTRKCIGFAKCCNVSNGYGLGIFFTVPVEDEQ